MVQNVSMTKFHAHKDNYGSLIAVESMEDIPFPVKRVYYIYDVEDGKVVASNVVGTNGRGHGALADLLSIVEVDTVICGGSGGGAQMALAANGIKVYGGVSGDADQAVEALLSGNLDYNPNVQDIQRLD